MRTLEIWCPDCVDIDPLGCWDGERVPTVTSNDFNTLKEALLEIIRSRKGSPLGWHMRNATDEETNLEMYPPLGVGGDGQKVITPSVKK